MNKADFERYLALYNAGDFERMAEYLHEDIELEWEGYVFTSKDSLIGYYRATRARVKETFAINFYIADETGIAVDMTRSFLAIEDAPNFLPHPLKKGETRSMRSLAFHALEDGKFIRIWGCHMPFPPGSSQ